MALLILITLGQVEKEVEERKKAEMDSAEEYVTSKYPLNNL